MMKSIELRFNKKKLLLLAVLTSTLIFTVDRARASPLTIEVTPTRATVGSIVTISGRHAAFNSEVRIYLDDTIFLATTTSDEKGGYSVNLTVPAVPSATYSLSALDVETGHANTTDFTIDPVIYLTPESGSFNDTVTVEGYGFRGDWPIDILFNDTFVTPWPRPWTNFLGSLKAKFQVPLMPNGTYPVTVRVGSNETSKPFSIVPKITAYPTSGSPGEFAIVFGSGFSPSANISISFRSINVTPNISITTASDGSFGMNGMPAIFFIPDVPDGTHLINASDETGNSATAPFTVPSATLAVAPNPAVGGSIITVTGSGFPQNIPVLLYFDNMLVFDLIDLLTFSEALQADEYGSYEYSFVVPVTEPGVYTITAYLPAESAYTPSEELASTSLTVIDNPLITEIKDKIATIIIPDLGEIKTSLDTINAELVSIDGEIVTVNTTLGLIETDLETIQFNITEIHGNTVTIETELGTLEGEITSIEGDLATIQTDLGTVKATMSNMQDDVTGVQTDVADVRESQVSLSTSTLATLVFALIGAVAAIVLLVMHIRVMMKSRR
ncbi:MAG: IPT/TIG domain-containing protein [Candidatus Bathyarchaeota archaeon]|nr:MAG: IPT/TIG domain-containing protein [Candidatus Bathyarchaeota archaeon]